MWINIPKAQIYEVLWKPHLNLHNAILHAYLIQNSPNLDLYLVLLFRIKREAAVSTMLFCMLYLKIQII